MGSDRATSLRVYRSVINWKLDYMCQIYSPASTAWHRLSLSRYMYVYAQGPSGHCPCWACTFSQVIHSIPTVAITWAFSFIRSRCLRICFHKRSFQSNDGHILWCLPSTLIYSWLTSLLTPTFTSPNRTWCCTFTLLSFSTIYIPPASSLFERCWCFYTQCASWDSAGLLLEPHSYSWLPNFLFKPMVPKLRRGTFHHRLPEHGHIASSVRRGLHLHGRVDAIIVALTYIVCPFLHCIRLLPDLRSGAS